MFSLFIQHFGIQQWDAVLFDILNLVDSDTLFRMDNVRRSVRKIKAKKQVLLLDQELNDFQVNII